MSVTKVTVWICSEHGEMEILEALEKAFCPKCGKEMKRVGEYEE